MVTNDKNKSARCIYETKELEYHAASEVKCTCSDHGFMVPVLRLVARLRHSVAVNQTNQKNATQPETHMKHSSDGVNYRFTVTGTGRFETFQRLKIATCKQQQQYYQSCTI